MAGSGDISYIHTRLDFLRTQPYYGGRTTLSSYLERLVGNEEQPDIDEQDEWKQWSEWLGNRPEVGPPHGYSSWKGRFLSHIDQDMGDFFD